MGFFCNPYKIWKLTFTAVLVSVISGGFAASFDKSLIYIGEPLTEQTISKYRHQKFLPISAVHAGQRAELELFDDPKLFSDLKGATLEGSQLQNEHWILAIARNHPKLSTLAIIQKTPLSKTATDAISDFSSLKYLSIKSELEQADQLISIPSSIEELDLSDKNSLSWKIPDLTNLKEFNINTKSVDGKFLELLNFPNLRILDLRNSDIAPKTFANIQRFKKLKEVRFYKSEITEDDYSELKKRGIRVLGPHR